MANPNDTVERIDLVVQEFDIAELLHVPRSNVRAFVHHRIECMAHQLTVQLLTPAKILQETKVAEYPIDWWNAIKARLGWKHKVRVHYLHESLLFPRMPVPKWAGVGDMVQV